ncbi:hypothetical protein B0H12DRAFT_342765 [Mycena haematopus]|nr:hypothetical protein B0H12DRAFT_342765 [Mycena haematopus]
MPFQVRLHRLPLPHLNSLQLLRRTGGCPPPPLASTSMIPELDSGAGDPGTALLASLPSSCPHNRQRHLYRTATYLAHLLGRMLLATCAAGRVTTNATDATVREATAVPSSQEAGLEAPVVAGPV